LPEHVDRHSAARVEIAADAKPDRLQEIVHPPPDADRAVLVKGAVVAKGLQVELQRLRFDQPFVGNVVDHHHAEIRLAGNRAKGSELGEREPGNIGHA